MRNSQARRIPRASRYKNSIASGMQLRIFRRRSPRRRGAASASFWMLAATGASTAIKWISYSRNTPSFWNFGTGTLSLWRSITARTRRMSRFCHTIPKWKASHIFMCWTAAARCCIRNTCWNFARAVRPRQDEGVPHQMVSVSRRERRAERLKHSFPR